jgi:hypothetical protein
LKEKLICNPSKILSLTDEELLLVFHGMVMQRIGKQFNQTIKLKATNAHEDEIRLN